MRKRHTLNSRSRLVVEPLEQRAMLAGNVHVFLDGGGNLRIIGDNRANGVEIDQFGEFTVRGIDAGGSPTRINGVPNAEVSFNVTGEGDFKIALKGGDDIVRVGTRSDDVNPPDDLEIDTAGGDDEITVTGDTNVADDLEIESGLGVDHVDVLNVDVADNLELDTGSGDDVVRLLAARVVGSTRVKTGRGADRVYIDDALFGGSFRLDAGKGDDYLQICRSTFEDRVEVKMGKGNDGLCVSGGSNFESEDVVFNGGKGSNDTRSIFDTVFAGEPLLGEITPRFEFDFDDCSFFPQADGTCGC